MKAHSKWTAAAALAAAWAVGLAQAGTRDAAFPGWFEALQTPKCLTPSSLPVTNGTQYRDDDANGILPGRWFMLVRWQNGDSGRAGTPPAGFAPSLIDRPMQFVQGSASNVSANAGIRVDCYDVALLVNTWTTPHRPIVGGGYNDMFGYAWREDVEVRPFVRDGKATHLMLQARMGITTYWPTLPDPKGSALHAARRVTKDAGSAQLCFFAYVRDTSHPELAPIALIAGVFDSEWQPGTPPSGGVAYDYDETMSETFRRAQPAWFVGDDSTAGVWFAAGPISRSEENRQPFVDTFFTEAETAPLEPRANEPNPDMPLYRAHFTAENMKAAVRAIRDAPCEKDTVICNERDYSLDPADYAISYAGVIAEVTLRNEREPDAWYDAGPGPGQWVPYDTRRGQVEFGVHVREIGIYRGIPN